jgi:hypothetical protein
MSSLIQSIEWENGTLTLTLVKGTYRYFDVEESVKEELERAESQGTYFNRNIKSKYVFEKVV